MNTAQDSKLQEVTGAAASEDKTKQSRYTVAVQKANGKTLCTQEVLRHTISTLESSAVKHMPESKRIVVSEEESYLYFGRLIDGFGVKDAAEPKWKTDLPPMTAITEMTNVMVSALIIINRDKFAILEIGKKTNATA